MGGGLGPTTPVAPRSRSVILGAILRKKNTGQDSVERWLISKDNRCVLQWSVFA